MKKSELIFSAILAPIDFLMLIAAGLTAYFLRLSSLGIKLVGPAVFQLNLPFYKYFILVLVVSLFWLAIFSVSGLYKLKSTRSAIEEFFKVAIASSAGIMGVIIYIFVKGEWFDSRFIIMAAWVLAIVFLTFGRISIRQIQKYLAKKYRLGVHKVLIIGRDKISYSIADEIKTKPSSGYLMVKHLLHPDIAEVGRAIGNPGIDEVILADPLYPRDKILELIDLCDEKRLDFKFVPNLFQSLTTNIGVDTFTGVPLIELKRTSLEGWGRIIKRVMDIVGSLAGLFVLSPLFLTFAFAIKWGSEGSVFVKLKRISQNEEFELIKFRSMVKNAEELKKHLLRFNERPDGPLFKMKNDPRITKVGRFIRKYRIDELPQFINVLRGEMSLVGPRPHEPGEVWGYEKHHKKVLAIKPGMTGLAQISGSSDLPFEEEIKLDTFYVERWSLGMDIKILLKTLIFLVKDKSAC